MLRDVSKDLEKRASAKSLLDYKKTPNQEDLHVIAVGAYEGTGDNRNGDRFLEKDCVNNHQYFKKSDRCVHRHHKNKPNDPKFGNVKAAAYNKTMKRIELVLGLDRDKCADILTEQEKTGNTNWSMACKIAYDICSECGHKARTDKERCSHIPRQLGEITKQGNIIGMVNPDPKWFEISYVRRPADRIGMSLGKLAADSTSVRPMTPTDYLQVYGDIYVPDDNSLFISKKAADKRALLQKLSALEKYVNGISTSSSGKDSYIKNHASKLNDYDEIPQSVIDELRKYDPKKVFKALADNGIILSAEEFSKYIFGGRLNKNRVAGMKEKLPTIFEKIEDNCEDLVNNEKYEPADVDFGMPAILKKLMSDLTEGHSLFGPPALRRVMRVTIMGKKAEAKQSGEIEKSKEASDEELAKQYIAYKVAALNYLDQHNKADDDILINAVIQNRK